MKPFFVFGIAIIALGVGNLSGEIKVIDLKDTAPPKDPLKSAIKWSKIQNRNGIAYLPNTDTPFNGYGKLAYDNEQVEVLAKFKDGFVVNLKQWRKNGIPRWQIEYNARKVSLNDVPIDKFSDSNDSHHHGRAISWHENGQKEHDLTYAQGKVHGHAELWSKSGQKLFDCNFTNGKPGGTALAWYENGQKQMEKNFLDGEFHGSSKTWHENGQIMSDTNMLKGEIHGLQRIYYKNGFINNESNFTNGKLQSAKVWKPNGEKCPQTNIENGNGVVFHWDENGRKNKMTSFKNGLLDGLVREWHENGMMSYERNFKQGKLHGLVTSWSEAGEQRYQINYVDGEEVDLPEDSPEVANENKVFSLDELDRIPSAIKNGDLVYPESLLGKGLSGEVKLLIQINERGRVMVMEILSATHPLFGKAASIAAENSLYEIPTRDGKPVSAQFHLPVKFTASQPSWSESEQISHNYKHGKVRLELSYTHQSEGSKKDQEEKFSTETILLVDGNFVYALIHAMDGPLRVSFNPHTLISMQGRITSQKLSKPITINEVAFMDDPRIIIVPLYANPEELRKTGLELFEAPANPFLFDDAVCMDVGKGKLGRIKCMRDQIDGRYIEVDERSFAFETGAINPGKGNLLFTRKSELLGIMINGDYAFHVKNLGSRIHGGSRTLLGSAFDSDKTNKLLRDLSGQFSTIDKRFKY